MRATEIIRSVLDLIDKVECSTDASKDDPIGGMFTQLFTQLSSEKDQASYDNSPNPHIQGIASVTTDAGGGLNGPKNPADLRADSVSMYPNFQAKE